MEQTETKRNPDVLECLANLSNDEVFTPPRVANAMLDLLPQELFRNPQTTFLDPCCKSGVFLREIAKRLIVGLEPVFPDLQERLDHIFHKQLFGFAITELTALTSRRTVYCSKFADGKYSISHFDTPEGNIRLPPAEHDWVDGKCRLCGASAETLKDRTESHAYAFIHGINPEKVFHMKFDVIIGNPPYQLNIGKEKENYAIPIYQEFVEQAKHLCPKYIVMIIPSRWYAGGRGLDEFREEMLHDNSLRIIHDFPNSSICFPNVDIAGGICYFLWDSRTKGDCSVVSHRGAQIQTLERPLLEPGCDTFIRHNEGISILRKVRLYNEETFDHLVSPQTPFGFVSSFRDFTDEPTKTNTVEYFSYGKHGYVNKDSILKARDLIDVHKLYISAAYGERGDFPYQFLGTPFYGAPNTCCSQSYLVIGPFENRAQAMNARSYILTRFFRSLVMLKKNAQHNMSYVFGLVPLQDFSKAWTDEELYAKYGLTEEEIAFIESMVKPMEV